MTAVTLSPRRVAWARRRRALGRTWDQYRSSRPGMIGLGILVLFVLMALAAPLSMLGTVVGGRILDRMSDVDFKRWTRWIVTGVGVMYLVRAAQLFAQA